MNPLLSTKFFIPKPRPELVSRTRLLDQLSDSLNRKLTLISAPAGFGKTTLISEWVEKNDKAVAWLSLDEDDCNLSKFLVYLVAAIQTVQSGVDKEELVLLQTPQSIPSRQILIDLLNQISSISDDFLLVLEDYHAIDSSEVDEALTFLLDNLPPCMHLIITTREDPNLPLARLRAQGQLNEIRSADLRFDHAEAAEFFNHNMKLDLSIESVEALGMRTEGWIAGLQLAAISLQGEKDTAGFIKSFTGSHHFVLDYLVEEVLLKQPETIQDFLLYTSILDRFCAGLCDAIMPESSISGRESLAILEAANLFIFPLDHHREWYRYHHLFSELLRHRLSEKTSSKDGNALGLAQLHLRASQWFEDNDFEVEAFQHAVAAGDLVRAERLMKGKEIPLQYRGGVVPVRKWLESLPLNVMDSKPSLWVAYASILTMIGKDVEKINGVLTSAESALQKTEPDEENRDLTGQVAAIRAMIAIPQNKVAEIITHSHRALENLSPDNISVRTTATWALGYAYQIQGDRASASRIHHEALSISQASGNIMISIAALTSLGQIQISENLLHHAAEYFNKVLQLAGEPASPVACEAHLGLARINYQWNNLTTAKNHAEISMRLARKMENIDTPANSELLLALIKFTLGDRNGALENLVSAEQYIHHKRFSHLMPELVAIHVLFSLANGNPAKAVHWFEKHDLPVVHARFLLAQGENLQTVEILKPYRQAMELKQWNDEQLKALILEAVAYHALENDQHALILLKQAINLAEPGGFIRLFIDEGPPMAEMLKELKSQNFNPSYIRHLLSEFDRENKTEIQPSLSPSEEFSDSLSERELEILQCVARGLSNREISERLFLSLNTIKGYNHRIFNKLQVQRRTEAVARARELDLI